MTHSCKHCHQQVTLANGKHVPEHKGYLHFECIPVYINLGGE